MLKEFLEYFIVIIICIAVCIDLKSTVIGILSKSDKNQVKYDLKF